MAGMGIRGRRWAPLCVWLAGLVPAAAQDLELRLPIDCTLGRDCYIQQYVDRDPGPDVRDIGCGTLANNDHKGTDFALPSLVAMEAGVDVLASATGVVRGVRDGMPDISLDSPGAPDIAGRECGNGVVLTHGDGWETQYCHLKNGSITVAPGDRVERGTPLGEVGLSGETTFPHVHVSVRQNGAVVDPFQPETLEGCGVDGVRSLWRSPPIYRAGGVITAGLAAGVPDYDAIKAGLPEDGIDSGAAPIVLWAYMFGGRVGDTVLLEIDGPGGTLGSDTAVLEANQPLLFRAWGRRAPDGGWPAGDYAATVTLRRDGLVLDTHRAVAGLP